MRVIWSKHVNLLSFVTLVWVNMYSIPAHLQFFILSIGRALFERVLYLLNPCYFLMHS